MDELKQERDLLAELVKTGEVFEKDLYRMDFLLDEIERIKRIHLGETDILFFALEYFSEDGNPTNADNLIPKGTDYDNSADFHRELCGMLDAVSEDEKSKNVAWACPRGSAKTSYLSNIFPTHQLVYRKQKYIVLFSETTDMAGDFIGWTRYQLKLNEKLREDFGGLLHERPSMNPLDNRNEFITTTNVKVEAKGLGTQARGMRHGATRPTLAILDDLESKESTNTTELIEKSKAFFREDVLPSLAEDGIVVYLGTILCYDSLLDYVIRERGDFESRKYSAITSWADREDLWDEWREIYREDSKEASDKAWAFYQKNKKEMDKGASVLWEQRWTYYQLMELLENNGSKAFNQEYLNNPTDEERQIFKPEYFTFYHNAELQDKEVEYYCGVDFAMGKDKGDYSVIVTIARNVDTGTLYVEDIFMQRLHPDEFLNVIIDKTLYYQYENMGVEAVMAQEFLADKLTDALQSRGYPAHTRLHKIKQKTRKAIRIEALLPEIQSGMLRFNAKYKNGQEIGQFEMYPMGKHDDVPDAVEHAFRTAQGGRTFMRTIRKRTR